MPPHQSELFLVLGACLVVLAAVVKYFFRHQNSILTSMTLPLLLVIPGGGLLLSLAGGPIVPEDRHPVTMRNNIEIPKNSLLPPDENTPSPQNQENPSNSQQTVPLLRIDEPSQASVIAGHQVTIRGRFQNLEDKDIWVIVWPKKANGKGWPQSPSAELGRPAIKRDLETWEVPCILGGPEQTYTIEVFSAPKNASRTISNVLIDWSKSRQDSGLTREEIPEELVLFDSIQVTKAAR